MASSRAFMRNVSGLKRRLQTKERQVPRTPFDEIDRDKAALDVRINELRRRRFDEPVAYVVGGPDGQPAIVSTQPGPVTEWAELVVRNEELLLAKAARDEHAEVDTVAVPDERRPSKSAPIRRLLGYLIRLVLRRWVKRIDGR